MNFIREVSNSAGENSKEKSDLLKNLQSINTHNKNKMNEILVQPSSRVDIPGWNRVSRDAQQRQGEEFCLQPRDIRSESGHNYDRLEYFEDQLVQKMKDEDNKPWEEIKKT